MRACKPVRNVRADGAGSSQQMPLRMVVKRASAHFGGLGAGGCPGNGKGTSKGVAATDPQSHKREGHLLEVRLGETVGSPGREAVLVQYWYLRLRSGVIEP